MQRPIEDFGKIGNGATGVANQLGNVGHRAINDVEIKRSSTVHTVEDAGRLSLKSVEDTGKKLGGGIETTGKKVFHPRKETGQKAVSGFEKPAQR